MWTVIKACFSPLERGIGTASCTLQKSGGPCLLQGLHYHTRGLPDRYTDHHPRISSAAQSLLSHTFRLQLT
ncbi:uncharacterized protein ACO6RY_18680 [Pungitius sinensis]